MSAEDGITVNQSSKRVKTAKLSCVSNMLIYHAKCGVCSKKYVGKQFRDESKKLTNTVKSVMIVKKGV